MNLSEFRDSMASDAIIENERLKRDIKDLEKKYDNMCNGYLGKIRNLNDDCRSLANRCFATSHGAICWACSLSEYCCPRALSFDDKLKIAQKIKEECECTAQNASRKISE